MRLSQFRRVQPQARANHRTYLRPPNEKQEMPWFFTVATKQTNVAEPAQLLKRVYAKVSSTPLLGDRRKGARMVAQKAHNRGLQKRVAIFRFIFRPTCKLFLLPHRPKVRNWGTRTGSLPDAVQPKAARTNRLVGAKRLAPLNIN
jgi:hypothetical protein